MNRIWRFAERMEWEGRRPQWFWRALLAAFDRSNGFSDGYKPPMLDGFSSEAPRTLSHPPVFSPHLMDGIRGDHLNGYDGE